MERETKIFAREDLLGIQSSYVSQMLEMGSNRSVVFR